MQDFLTALALAVALEGLLYALFPNGMKKAMAEMLTLPPATLRAGGLVAACVGVGLVWIIRG